jgi:hypothetical protein
LIDSGRFTAVKTSRPLWLVVVLPLLAGAQEPAPTSTLVAGRVRAASTLDAAALAGRDALPTPGIVPRPGLASPTRVPWVQTNGWRYVRGRDGKFSYDLPAGKGALGVAEALAYGGDVLVKFDAADAAAVERLFALAKSLPEVSLPDVADFGVIDDGTPLTGEAMNLFVRRNLLFARVTEPAARFPFTVKLGTPEYPISKAADPSGFALEIRRKLTDEKRSLRVYGSEVLIGRLTGDGARARLALVNYGNRELVGVRLRVRGTFSKVDAYLPGQGRVAVIDLVTAPDGATEFSMPAMASLAIVELSR